MKKILLLLAATGCALLPAAEVIRLDKGGALNLGDTVFQLHAFNAAWRGFRQTSSGKSPLYQVRSADQGTVRLKLAFPDLPEGGAEIALAPEKEGAYRYSARLHFNQPAEIKELALEATLPVAEFAGRAFRADGKNLVFPATYAKGQPRAFLQRACKSLELPTDRGVFVLTGDFFVFIQDNRSYQSENFSLRLRFQPDKGAISEAKLEFTVALKPYPATPVDLRETVNMGFTDAVADDRKGGWTDQGPERDLGLLPTGRINLYGVDFDIIDPEKNGGRSCLMLAGFAREYFPRRAVCKIKGELRGRYLHLLHATAWSANKPLGELLLRYADGETTRIAVDGAVDVGNWWNPVGRKNADVVWSVKSGGGEAGLYRVSWPIDDKPISEIEFHSTGSAVWGIVAASVSADPVPRPLRLPYLITAGKEWREIASSADIEPGSALDFSSRLEAPAGKYGPVEIRGGRFVFRDRPEQPARFYGTNLVETTLFTDREWAERIAERIAALGFNLVRLHHHDNPMANPERTTELNPEKMERLDYLVSCFKKRGIYLTTDLYISRRVPAGEIPEYDRKVDSIRVYKALFWILDSAFLNWREHCRSYFNHVNPYTGLSPKDDPVYVSAGLVNEGNINACWNADPFTTKLYEERFRAWLAEFHPGEKAVADNRDPLFSLFLVETYRKRYAQMVEFLRGEGVHWPLSDMNMNLTPLHSVMRAPYDYVDNHLYWSHPAFPGKSWGLPSTLTQQSVLAASGNVPGRMFASRLYGKPFTVTEFDYARPNRCRAEGAPVMAAYAALQGWDMLCQFAYAHAFGRVKSPKDTSNHFDLINDPVKRLSNQLAARLFLDGGLRMAEPAFVAVVPGPEGLSFRKNYSNELNRLGLVARVGTVVGDPAGRLPAGTAALLRVAGDFTAPAGVPAFPAGEKEIGLLPRLTAAGLLPSQWFDAERGIYRSATGQLELDSKKAAFKAVTPGCEVLILPEKEAATLPFLTVRNRVGRGVFAALSTDGRPLAEAKRLLFFHLTDAMPSRTRFADARMNRLESWGELPWLAARGEAEAELALPPGNWRVYALDLSGKRLGEIKTKTTPQGRLNFEAKVFQPAGRVLAYEICL